MLPSNPVQSGQPNQTQPGQSVTRPVSFASLPVPVPSLPPIRRRQSVKPAIPASAFIPLFYAALLDYSGIALARYQYLRPSWLLLGLVPLTLLGIVTILRAPRLAWLPIAAVWISLGWWSAETEPQPAPNRTVAQLADGLLRTLEGTVTEAGPLRPKDLNDSEDRETDPSSNPDPVGLETQHIDLNLTAAEVVTDSYDEILPISSPESDSIRVTIAFPKNGAPPILCGQRLRAVLRLTTPDSFHDPGIWNSAAWLESQRISATATLNPAQHDGTAPGSPLRLIPLGPPQPSVACWLNRTRNAASQRLQSLPELTASLPRFLRASPADAAMLTAVLTGDRTYLTRGLRAGFERTGSFHLVVVSGLHLAILAGCVFALARRLRMPRGLATFLTLALTLAYALLTGFGLPAQRSFWMIALYLLGRLLYRNRSPLNILGFAALCLAAVSPSSIFDASLQMTVLSVAAITGIAVPLTESIHACIQATRDLKIVSIDPKLPPAIAEFRVLLRLVARHLAPATSPLIAWSVLPWLLRSIFRLVELVFITIVVELALTLPMALYFHRITLYALPLNLILLTLLTLMLPSAMLMLLVLLIWPAAATIAAIPALAFLHFGVWLVHRLGTLQFSDLRVPHPAPGQIFLALLLFVLALQLARWKGPPRRLAFASLIAMAAVALFPRPIDHPQNSLLFEAIDVGQGDALLLISPEGKTLLVDAGGLGLSWLPTSSHTAPQAFDTGEDLVSPTLWSRGIRRLDAVALTHAHHDHMGGLAAVLRNFRPRELWVGNNPPVPAYKELLQQAQAQGTAIRALHSGESVALGALQVRVLAPDAAYHPGHQPANNDSLVLQAVFRQNSVLLAGDAEAPEEDAILSQTARASESVASTVLKVGHHGSLTSTRPDFLTHIAPAWAVISCGRHNRFGHPRPEILAELQAAHVRTFRTDLDGISCLQLDGHGGPESVTPLLRCQSSP